MQSIIFIDSEGDTIQELAAIEVDRTSNEIKDSYLEFARNETDDCFSRVHIHGLSTSHLQKVGFSSEAELIVDFKRWIDTKPYVAIYANNPRRECSMLNAEIKDITLPSWAERRKKPYHRIAKIFKDHMIPLAGKRCSHSAHSMYHSPPPSKTRETYFAKMEHEFHCGLYDVYELYLCYLCRLSHKVDVPRYSLAW